MITQTFRRYNEKLGNYMEKIRDAKHDVNIYISN
jgi:hypothetical protein